MFLKKASLSLAFIGLATPSLLQTGYLSTSAVKYPQAVAKTHLGDLNPFNPQALVHHYQKQGNYYAYYQNDAFKSSYPSYGYIAKLSRASMPFLTTAYEWAQSHQQNPLGAMISYIINTQPDASHYMPYTNTWSLSKRFFDDTNPLDGNAILSSFESGDSNTIVNMIQQAYSSFQTVNFNFFSTFQNTQRTSAKAQVEIVNTTTGATYTTPWKTYSPINIPFNPQALQHHYAQGDDYYAYYANTAFKSDQASFGYVARLSSSSLTNLRNSYRYGLKHQQNALGSMVSYLVAKPLPFYAGVKTPYTNGWGLNSHFLSDINLAEGRAILDSFEAGDAQTIVKMVNNAITNHETIALYFFTEYLNSAHATIQAKVELKNLTTQKTYTTPWKSYTRYPFNPDAFSHDAHGTADYHDYYAYYANSAFQSEHLSYGYVATLSTGSMPYLLWAYDYAQEHHQNGLGAMISYLIGNEVSTPYSGAWTLSSHFHDANNTEIQAFTSSFEAGDASTITKMINEANANQQRVQFFFFSTYHDSFGISLQAKVEVVNMDTGTAYTTPWRSATRGNPFNPWAFVHAVRHTDSGGTDYYAYYANDAFSNPYGDYNDFGYVAQLSNTTMESLHKSYQYARDHSQSNPFSSIYTVFANYWYEKIRRTPSSGDWVLSSTMTADWNVAEGYALFNSAEAASQTEGANFVEQAYNDHQNLAFFFYTAYSSDGDNSVKAQIVVYNPITYQSFTTPWAAQPGT